MARLSLIFIIVLGVVFPVVTSVIRWEMSLVEVSAAVEWLGQKIDLNTQDVYVELAHVHGMFGTILFLLVASFLAFAKAQPGKKVGFSIGILSFSLAIIQLCIMVWEISHLIWPANVINYPLSLDHVNSHQGDWVVEVEWLALIFSEEYFRTAALTLTVAATACAVCINAAYRLGALLLMALIVAAFTLFSYFYLRSHAELSWSFLLVPQVVLLAVLAIVMIDPNHPDEPHLTMGVGITLVAGLAFDLISSLRVGTALEYSYFDVANAHLSQHALMVFAFFAAYFSWFGPGLNPLRQWLHAAVMSLAYIVSYMPMMAIGLGGGLAETLEIDPSFADLQRLASLGFAGICVTVIWGLIMPWSGRLFDLGRPDRKAT